MTRQKVWAFSSREFEKIRTTGKTSRHITSLTSCTMVLCGGEFLFLVEIDVGFVFNSGFVSTFYGIREN